MEAAGLALAVTSLALSIYTKCKKASADFHHLDQDLKSFHDVLIRTEPYLLPSDSVIIACKELVADIEKLLSKYHSRRRWNRVQLSLSEIEPLRARLLYQISVLHVSANFQNHQNSNATQKKISNRIDSPQLTKVSSVDYFGSWEDEHRHTFPDVSMNAVIPVVSEEHFFPTSWSTPSSNIAGQIASPESFSNDNILRDRFSTRSSLSYSSTSTATTELSTPLSQFETWRFPNEIATREADFANSNRIRLSNSNKWDNDALIAISKTERQRSTDIEQVKNLLRKGASWQYKDPESFCTALIWATVVGRKDLVDVFVKQGAPLDDPDGSRDRTPVMWAVVENQLVVLNILINAGADLTAVDSKTGYTALLWAASIGNCNAAKALLDKQPDLIGATDKDGMTPLALSYFEDHLDTAKVFITSGDDVNFKCKYGSSLLAWALRSGHVDFATLLLEHGADPQSTDMNGTPVLILAVKQGFPILAELLVTKGADLQCTDADSVPVLTLAVKSQRLDIAEMLIRNGARLDTRDGDGNTALLWAVWRDNEAMVKLLVEGKADTRVADGEGKTLKEWAAWTGNDEIIRLISLNG